MLVDITVLLVCAVLIYLACEWFTNGVEWLGVRLAVRSAAVGTVLAAAGTALPESVVTAVAVLFGAPGTGADVGVGSAVGGPLVVGSIAYAVAGVVLLLARRSQRRAEVTPPTAVHRAAVRSTTAGGTPAVAVVTPAGGARGVLADLDTRGLAHDQAWFLGAFVVATGLGLVAFAAKPWLGWAFFAAYAVYCWRSMRGGGAAHTADDLEPLRLQPRRDRPATWAVVMQVALALAVVFVASQLFVGRLEALAPALGLPASLVALLLAPVATELPEVLNALVWVRQGKPALALGNLSGSMVIQATVPVGLGVVFTPWQLTGPLLLAAAATLLCVGYLLVLFAGRRVTAGRLALAAVSYAAFAVALPAAT